jgi:hypothetical protein
MSVEQLTSLAVSAELQPLTELGVPLDPAERAAQLESITGEGIITMLDKVHRIVAPDLNHDHNLHPTKLKDPEGTVTGILATPEERAPIFDLAAQKVRELFEAKSPENTQAFLNRAADTIALSVVLAHPYEDGNGRSARAMAQLVRYGLDLQNPESIDDMVQLSTNRPAHGFRVNGYLPRKDAGEGKTPQDLIARMARTDIPLSETADYLAQRQAEFSEPYTD